MAETAAEERAKASPRQGLLETEDEIEERLGLETEKVIRQEQSSSKGKDEAQRSAVVFMSLYEVLHADKHVLDLPDDTLYSAFVVMPMIARSSGYTLTMTAIALKMIVLTLVCIGLQGGLIMSLFHARVHLPAVLGVPSLCTYGQDTGKLDRKPFGPSGLEYQNTYGNVETDYIMVIVRNTLYEIMKKVGVENDAIGPVEYGMESTTCRVVCVAVFCVAICGEIFSMETMARFLYFCPTLRHGNDWSSYTNISPEDRVEMERAKWVEFEESANDEQAKVLFPLLGKSALDHVNFKCNGMPFMWKLLSWIMLAGRGMIVLMTFWNGLAFLMNTGGIVDLILNSLALIFIIDLDRIMFTTLARGLTKDIMRRLEPYKVKPEAGVLNRELEKRRQTEVNWGVWAFLKSFVYINLSTLVLIAVTIGGHYAYFYEHCQLEVWPLDFTQWFSPSYFMGQTRYFGGWEFIFGSWVSTPTVDKYSTNITCSPAMLNPSTGAVMPPTGCGLPTPWAP